MMRGAGNSEGGFASPVSFVHAMALTRVLWAELMQQLPPEQKREVLPNQAFKKQILLFGQQQTVGQLAASEPVTAQVCQQVRQHAPQLWKPQLPTGAGLNLCTLTNVIYGHVFPSHPLRSPILRNAIETYC